MSGCVPIISENDNVVVEVIEAPRLAENDVLVVMSFHALRGELLLLLTVIDG